MSLYFVYLMSYSDKRGERWYCGYTNDPKRREAEHRARDHRHWLTHMHVIARFPALPRGRRDAMREERRVKRLNKVEKTMLWIGGERP